MYGCGYISSEITGMSEELACSNNPSSEAMAPWAAAGAVQACPDTGDITQAASLCCHNFTVTIIGASESKACSGMSTWAAVAPPITL